MRNEKMCYCGCDMELDLDLGCWVCPDHEDGSHQTPLNWLEKIGMYKIEDEKGERL
jgi:hypothetical protein